jgi:hypothetical protein
MHHFIKRMCDGDTSLSSYDTVGVTIAVLSRPRCSVSRFPHIFNKSKLSKTKTNKHKRNVKLLVHTGN